MDTPFKIIVDSRNASEGHGGKFSFSLPQVTQVPAGFCCYINQASVTNSFLSVGTFVGSDKTLFYWIERLAGNATVLTGLPFQSKNMMQKALHRPFEQLWLVQAGSVATSTLLATIRPNI